MNYTVLQEARDTPVKRAFTVLRKRIKTCFE